LPQISQEAYQADTQGRTSGCYNVTLEIFLRLTDDVDKIPDATGVVPKVEQKEDDFAKS
jgi:hypothetical protein